MLFVCQVGNRLWGREETMFWLGAKSQNFIATTILAGAVMLCWSADAADVTIHMERDNFGWVYCNVVNHGPYNVCAVVDVYPYWDFGHPTHKAIAHSIPGKGQRRFHFGRIDGSPPLKCKLISAKYRQPYLPCP